MPAIVTPNPLRRLGPALDPPDPAVTAFHRRLPGYEPSPLLNVPSLAAAAGVAGAVVKDESDRFGLPAFKILGASWAGYRALISRLSETVGTGGQAEVEWSSLGELAVLLDPLRPLDLATATDGNHGRAVARLATWLGFGARIFVPAGTARARIDAIEGEGASCTVVDGTYDDAVERAAREAGDRCIVLSDTSWAGYEDLPNRVIDGYRTIFAEIDDQLAADPSLPRPTAVVVPVGVGALAASAARWYRSPAHTSGRDVTLIGVEPHGADCVGASVRAGHPVEVPGPHRSVMAGLCCGRPSPVAWPAVSSGFDVFAAIGDEEANAGVRALAGAGVVAGESGAAGAGLLVTAGGDVLGLGADDVVLLLSTEGPTDPVSWESATGRRP